MYSGNRLPRDLVVQLCDEADNPTAEENVRIQLTREATALKVVTLRFLPLLTAAAYFISCVISH